MSDRTIALLRTAVPMFWGHLAVWLVGLGVPADWLHDHQALILECLAVALSLGWWALWNWLAPHLPSGLVGLLTGHPGQPTYGWREAIELADTLTLDDLDVEPAGIGDRRHE